MIYTSYFGNMKKIKALYPSMCFVSIAGKTPNWFFEYENCYSYKILAPRWSWWKEWHDKFKGNLECLESIAFYEERYNKTVLDMLNVGSLVRELQRLSNSNDVCLLCYEVPTKFCHRHLVAKKINIEGFHCEELIINDRQYQEKS